METNRQPNRATNDYTWYYIIVQEPGTEDEQIAGFEEKDTGKLFIPAFKTKEEAQQCFLLMPKDIMKYTYEAQAIIEEDLMRYADQAGYRVFLMNEKSTLIKQLR